MPSNPRRHGAGRSSDRRPREHNESERPHRGHGEGGPRAHGGPPRQPPPQADVEATPPPVEGAPPSENGASPVAAAPAAAGTPGAAPAAPPAPQRPSLNIAAMKDMGIQALTQI